ncbi:ABC transporter substrate-binding protein [Thermus scotoductus]|uniref:ABC transporter substrate-binding protein n=2 Tax=Thermus TaxID=270 RepID=A0A430UYU8_THESC|nr:MULTISPECIES: ABC transporter substrate-binding protein [Thermus]QWK21540.1 MAG: ABC transporter substrate-binding protein [Thermus antranikianii]RTH98287.1 ABC transporter substrate-binding protein [Thermus scotoductus]RTI14690.1 ABC transporter substrate-binding protein [Thermus scotoductus]WCM39702.1 extracellular solute-binding protein [Thermus antranikianii]
MLRILVVFVAMLGLALAQTQVRISGWGGTDIAIVNGLLKEVVQPKLDREGIRVIYQPIEGDYTQWLFNALSAGTAPDLFYVDIFWAESLFATGRVEPLDAHFSKQEVGEFLPNLVQAFTYRGKLYGIPKDFNTLALVFNKDLFDEAKVLYPNQQDTWETFEAKIRQVQSRLKDVAGICLVADFARFGAFAFATGWKPFDEKGHSVLDQHFRRAFEWYTGLIRRGAAKFAQDLGEGWTGGCFGSEKAATALEGAWIAGFLRDKAPNLRYGTTFLPLDPVTRKRGNFIFTVSWSLNAASTNKAAAVKVLKALTSPEAQQWVLERGLAIPSRRALANNPYFQRPTKESELNRVVFQGSTAQGGNVYPFSFRGFGGDWMRPINEAIQAVIGGQKSVDQAIRDAQAALDRLTGRR